MPLVPARCRRCGHEFQNNAADVGPGASVQFIGTTTDCPRCGGLADLAQGRLEGTASGFIAHDAPQWTRDMLERLQLVLPRIIENPPDDPVALIADQVSAQLAARIDDAVDKAFKYHARTPSKNRKRQLVLGIVGTVVAALGFDTAVAEDNIDHVRETFDKVLDYVVEHGDVPKW